MRGASDHRRIRHVSEPRANVVKWRPRHRIARSRGAILVPRRADTGCTRAHCATPRVATPQVRTYAAIALVAMNALEETASSTRSRTKSPADRLERESFHWPRLGHRRRYAAAISTAVPPPHAPRAVRSLPSANPRVRIVRSAPRRRGPFAGNGRTAGAARVQGSRNSRVAVRRNGCRTGQIGQSRLSSSWC